MWWLENPLQTYLNGCHILKSTKMEKVKDVLLTQYWEIWEWKDWRRQQDYTHRTRRHCPRRADDGQYQDLYEEVPRRGTTVTWQVPQRVWTIVRTIGGRCNKHDSQLPIRSQKPTRSIGRFKHDVEVDQDQEKRIRQGGRCEKREQATGGLEKLRYQWEG